MKICFIYRKSGYRFSIENVFHNVKLGLKATYRSVEIEDYYWNSDYSFIKNIYLIRSKNVQIYHITGDINYVALFLLDKRVVSTIHDLGSYLKYTGVKKWIYGLFWVKLPVLSSQITTVVSEFTKSQITEYFLVSPKKIKVVSNPVGKEFIASDKCSEKNGVLIVGTGLHKNIVNSLKSLYDSGILVRIVGSIEHLEEMVEWNRLEFTLFQDISSSELSKLYRISKILLFPSYHEGFGLPIIEAQASLTAVITSSIAPMNIVVGEGGVTVDPDDIDMMSFYINRLIADDFYYNSVVKNGVRNVRKYKPESVAEVYYNIYENLF